MKGKNMWPIFLAASFIVFQGQFSQAEECKNFLDVNSVAYQSGKTKVQIDVKKNAISIVSKLPLENLVKKLRMMSERIRPSVFQLDGGAFVYTIEMTPSKAEQSRIQVAIDKLASVKEVSRISSVFQSRESMTWNDGQIVIPLLSSTGEISVRFFQAPTAVQLQNFLDKYNLVLIKQNEFSDKQYLVAMKKDNYLGNCFFDTISAVDSRPDVKFSNPNFIRRKP